MLIGYARVSTQDQTTYLQIDALTKTGCERIFEEKASGAKADRPELLNALHFMRKDDVLVVWRLDRLARSMKQLIDTVDLLSRQGVELRSLTEAIDTSTASGKLVFGIFASLAEFERSLIRERVNAGLASARSRGRTGGRPPVREDILTNALTLVRGGMAPTKACQVAGLSRSTLYKALSVQKT